MIAPKIPEIDLVNGMLANAVTNPMIIRYILPSIIRLTVWEITGVSSGASSLLASAF